MEHRISAVPVVDEDGMLVGIVSEGDLMRRAEIGTERRHPWWLELLALPETRAREFVKANGTRVAEVMTRDVVTATEDTPLDDLAKLLEKNGIKRVPIVREGKVVGIVSRRNIVQALVRSTGKTPPVHASDTAICEQILEQVRSLTGGKPWLLSIGVTDGIVELWGPVQSVNVKTAIRLAAEATPGVKSVKDQLYYFPL